MDTSILWNNVERLGTPSYVFDIEELKKQIRYIQKIVGEEIELCYAMKANPFLVTALKEEIGRFEVCSPGEFHICVQTGVEASKIVLSGVNKAKEDILYALSYGVRTFTVESLQQLQLINLCAQDNSCCVLVLLRLSSGNQFGMDMETIHQIIREREKWSNIVIEGLQMYSGTQKRKREKLVEEIDTLQAFCEILCHTYEVDLNVIEYGPGMGISYFESDDGSFEAVLSQMEDVFETKRNGKHYILEMGRLIASGCGYYLSRIADIKITGENRYCIIDGGINHINYYGQIMGMKIPKIDFFSANHYCENTKWNICGSLCTTADVLAKNLELPGVNLGDLLVFKNIGAYSITEGIYLFLSRKMPKVYFYTEKDGFILVRDEIETYKFNMVKNEMVHE